VLHFFTAMAPVLTAHSCFLLNANSKHAQCCWVSRLTHSLPKPHHGPSYSHLPVQCVSFRPNSLHALSWALLSCIHHMSSECQPALMVPGTIPITRTSAPMRHPFLMPMLFTWYCMVTMASGSYLSLEDVELKAVSSPGCSLSLWIPYFFQCPAGNGPHEVVFLVPQSLHYKAKSTVAVLLRAPSFLLSTLPMAQVSSLSCPFLSMSLHPPPSHATEFHPSRTLVDVFTSQNSHVRWESSLRFSSHCSAVDVLFPGNSSSPGVGISFDTSLFLHSQECGSPFLAFVEYIGTSTAWHVNTANQSVPSWLINEMPTSCKVATHSLELSY